MASVLDPLPGPGADVAASEWEGSGRGLLDGLLEDAREGVWAVDEAGTTLFASARMAAMLGCAPEELHRRPLSDFLGSPDDEVGAPPPTREGSAILLRRRDGTRFWAGVATIPLAGVRGAERGSVHLVSDLTRRMDAEARLRESESRFRALFEGNPQPMWIYDLETLGFLEVNDAAVARYGYSRDEFLAMTLRDIRPHEDVPALERQVASVTTGLDLAGVWRHRRKDGTILLVEIVSHTIFHRGRRAECVVAHDVTERRRAEEALVAIAAGSSRSTGEEFLRSAVSHLASALAVRWALAGELLPGFPQRVRTLAVWEGNGFAPNVEYPLAGSPCEHVLGRGMAFHAHGVRAAYPDHAMLAATGAEAFLGAALSDSQGRPLGIVAVLHDRPLEHPAAAAPILSIFADRIAAEIERMRGEEALRKSEATMRAILAAVPDEMLLVRSDGVVLDGHPRPGGVLGRPVGEQPADLAHVLPAELVAPIRRRLDLALGDGSAQTWEQELGRVGAPRSVEVRLVPRGRDDVLVVLRDVTERRRLDERIRQTQRLEGLEVLAGGIAHDFNNLLASVMGHAGLALAHLPDDSPLRPFVRNIETAAQRGAELTRQMLAYSGRGRLVTERISVARLIEEMVHLLRTVVTRSAVLDLDLAPDLPCIEGDATQVRQVFMNLLTNASDAIGRQPGSIVIRASVRRVGPGAPPEETFEEGLAHGDYVGVEVADTGCGMDARTRERLFDPFFTTKFTGRGLGLAAARGIVRAHRGAIRVESEPGKGSRFTVLFPSAGTAAARAPEPVCEPACTATGAPGSGLILLVDDEAEIRAMARAVLEEEGYSVQEAPDGVEAVRLFRERAGEIRLVLLDLTMPNRDGDEAFRDILAIRPDARVILTSGGVESDVASRVDRSRLAGILPKPYHTGQLVAAVRSALAERAPAPAEARS